MFWCGSSGPELYCRFEESESDCNGPPCAPACLPLRFTTHLIRSAEKLAKNQPYTLLTHILCLVYLYFPSVCLSHSPSPHPPSLLYCVPVASRGFYYSCIHFLTRGPLRKQFLQLHDITDVFFPLDKTSNDASKIKPLYHRSLFLNPIVDGATGIHWFSYSQFSKTPSSYFIDWNAVYKSKYGLQDTVTGKVTISGCVYTHPQQ